MIYTLTLNPSIDYIINIEKFVPGGINLTKSEYKLPGGKGINVSQVLSNLHTPNTTLGFIGGFTGEFIKKSLDKKNINHDFIEVRGDTRINIKMKDSSSESEINGNSPEISEAALKNLKEKLGLLISGDTLVLSGSVPKSISPAVYKNIMTDLPEGVKVILDTKGEALLEGIKGRPYMIKPNNHELGDIFHVKLESLEDTIIYGKKLLDLGAQNIIVSMAGDGALLITPAASYVARAPKGKLVNSVGAGDSLVAGFTCGVYKGLDIVKAFKLGIACGSASAFSENLCTEIEVDRLLKEVKIEQIIDQP
ncbi:MULTISPECIES: 1-phosphofructokinase [Psychrilyobacter]|uniref:1-phosphofructokinase n=1 Tax=Psychrilyobacter piezotolerans TaxID=2293438 RepID=A0ABX9KHU4_9FUSO|nr:MULTISPECIES: 1-phosphofructokinase [Psychrilyobacter]MCS5421819.1 1-phosphofructokinase [Psychrilyobacter sp. S5]NDI77583.1 1-phosphofructokinase [Psychrilyobacter piezotolerans]RDE62909.1 1-phosphofructokinase [Psychrilyobacter sp. S5]REI41667.1 1-phosphofructokinase [Psychrilyobacter piezotolerans]